VRNAEHVEVDTFDIRETGLYSGTRIAGTSDDVVEAVLTKEYSFADGIASRIIDIPARFDRSTGRAYISGLDGKNLMQIVTRYRDIVRKQRACQSERLQRAPMRICIVAPDIWAA
jgi:hypothetical protein